MKKNLLLAFAFTSLFLAAGAAFAAVSSGENDPLVLIPGTWDWANRPGSCQDNPQTLTLSPDRLRLTLEYKKPVTNGSGQLQKSEVYKILDARARLLHTQGTDPKGQPVIYDFVFASNDSFCWHRGDWPKGQCTKTMVRCSALAH
jgi:hypothetical protein